MVAGTLSDEYVSPLPAARLWKASIKDVHNIVPKVMPHIISSVDICEGDGGVGTVKQFNFTEAVQEYRFVKDRTDVFDEEKFFLKYTVIEGERLGTRFNSLVYEVKFDEAANGGTVAKMKADYDTIGDATLSDDEVKQMKENLLSLFKAVEAFLLQNPDAYA
ncbi:major allergen Pru ar 1 [Amborella trichopoda]|uniref:Bet v I/Major latex protein domain-containing protein n=1 Tax=Amborella trichopoda TaxID=13333 RepID=W1P051_AMBTC|nr:major allergen Pru ar 1 [Amborella trichopoda]ERN03197.1 hypothetical protein AMTR_s00003p00148140 [Amborella trichopoda]|eukprot:XP_006841522.1 major allergen Pru ar 1 [Amborella trichopoda]